MPSHGVFVALAAASVSLFAAGSSAETVLGAYIFARHGDRTSKSTPPAVLTELGYRQVVMTGQFYRDRYLASSSQSRIQGINGDIIRAGQVSASAPADDVLQKSATAFFQALYPPAGNAAKSRLRNGTEIESPMNGYQLVAIEKTGSGKNSENLAWLQSATKCENAKVSSANYFNSKSFKSTLDATNDFYKSLTPMLKNTFSPDKINYKNAYALFDLLNVASIQNSSDNFPSADLLTPQTYARLFHLASEHQYNLAYNDSEQVRAISGSVLGGDVLAAFKGLIASKGQGTKLGVQFGAYATFLSFFGLTELPKFNNDFFGIPNYASAMAFELVTNASTSSFPDPADISVRFLFNNGTILANGRANEFPLFNQPKTVLPWAEFSSRLEKVSITSQEQWCKVCGGGPDCGGVPLKSSSAGTGKTGGLTTVQAGVIGAMVTLAVVLGVQLLVMLVAGFRFVSKATLYRSREVSDKASA
ncbi:hypothetical protein LOZ53_006146 [Ophidiomyces ophidiicola]|nr:hypothetical protein LOZ53_006146 [Ophidiomyces ophidiicola]